MLLDEDKNANFHNLLVGSKTGLDSILKFFQGIIREIMDNIEKDTSVRNSAITKEEEDWIRFYQMKVRKTVLKFCMRRAAFGSDPLTVACDVSGLNCVEEAYCHIGLTCNKATRIDEILSAQITPVKEPSSVSGAIEAADETLIEIEHEHDEIEVEESHQSLLLHPSKNRSEEIIPASPANVPFVPENEIAIEESDVEEDIEDYSDKEGNHEEKFDSAVESEQESENTSDDDEIEILDDSDSNSQDYGDSKDMEETESDGTRNEELAIADNANRQDENHQNIYEEEFQDEIDRSFQNA